MNLVHRTILISFLRALVFTMVGALILFILVDAL